MSYYIITGIYIIFVWGMMYNFSRTGSPRSILFACVFFVAFLIILNFKFIRIELISNLIINLAVIFSSLSLIAFFGYLLGFLNFISYTAPGFSSDNQTLVSFGGFISIADYVKSGFTIRNTSFWTEPAKFAQYLQIPLFFSLKNFFDRRSMKSLLKFSIIFVAFILTFSVANYYAILLALLIYFIFRKGKNLSLIFKIIMLLIIIISLNYFYLVTNKVETEIILGKRSSYAFDNRFERFSSALNFTIEQPFGDKRKTDSTGGTPTALGNALIDGGFFLVILIGLLMINFFKFYIKYLLSSRNSLKYVGYIAYFVAFNWYGNYFSNFYVFNLALFLTFIKHEKQKGIINEESTYYRN